MMVGKKIFLILFLCIMTECAFSQERQISYTVDSVKVTLYDFNNSTYFDYFHTVLSLKDLPTIIANISQASIHAKEINYLILLLFYILIYY